MKLVAIFNVWADCACLLPYAVENIRPVVDGIIIVYSKKSNRGNVVDYGLPADCILVRCEPNESGPHTNETAKRNAGLEAAKALNFTHFIMLDADEFYTHDEFNREKALIEQSGVIGSVCRVKTYFKSPTLTIGYDTTLVPFIHKIGPSLKYVLKFTDYPYAYDNGSARIDGTRRLNISHGVRLSDITMHHFSWVRKDFKLKMENSSANFKPERTARLYSDLKEAKPGYFCQFYKRELKECPNYFNLPEYEFTT